MAQDPLAQLGTPAIPAADPVSNADPLAALGTPAVSVATQTPPSEGILSKVGDFAKGVGEGAVTSAGESIQSLPWVGKKILSPEAMQAEREYFKPGSAAEKAGQTTGDIAEPVLEFVMGDEALKGLAIADKIGIAGKIAKIAQDSPYIGKLLQHGVNAARMGTVGTAEALAKGATPGQALKTGAATGIGGEALSAAAEAAPSAIRNFKNPFWGILEGKGAAQGPAAEAVRGAVGAGADAPILQGAKTVIDEPLANLATKEKAAYKAVDDAAGFDVKEAKLGLKNDQYSLQQLGNTEADKAARVKLQASIADSTKRIGDAEAKLSAAGIDPKAADALHTSRMAGVDFKNSLVRATAPDGTINVDKLLNQSKVLRFSKRGDRLAQFMGKDGADRYMAHLQAAQDAGTAAVHKQQIAKWLTVGVLGLGAVEKGVSAVMAP